MNIVLVDDNNSDLDKLKSFIAAYYTQSLVKPIVKTFSSGENFLAANITKDVDIIFLDIFMNAISGIDVAKTIRETNARCLIVFSSTSNCFASESYDVCALEYLTKPYDYDKFAIVMEKIDEKIRKSLCFFDLKLKGEIKRIVLSKILYIDYSNHYVQIHTSDEIVKSYMVTFNEVSETLLRYPNFLWTYRNVLINMDKVSKLEDKCFSLVTGENILINRSKFTEIKDAYFSYVFSKLEGAK